MGALVATKASRAECIGYALDYLRWARMNQGRDPRRVAHQLAMAAIFRRKAGERA